MTSITPIEKLNNVITNMSNKIHSYSVNPYVDFSRNRKLPADTLIKTILNMQGNSINAELYNAFNYNDRMSASAFCQARAKLQKDTFELLFRAYNRTMSNPKTLNGYRVFAIDGSDFNTPFNPNSKFYFENGNNKPYCQMHANILFDLVNRTYQDCIIQPRINFNERKAAVSMLQSLNTQKKNIVIMDRGYGGYNMIEHCNRIPGLRYIIRERISESVALKEIASLPETECDKEVEVMICRNYTKAKENNYVFIHARKNDSKKALSKNTSYQNWDFESPCPVKFRICKFRINNPDSGKEQWEVLVTNLNKNEFPLSKMKELYHMRWDIETSFRELKYALGSVQFHSKKDDFVVQELFAHLTMFNLVSRTINNLDMPKKISNNYTYAIDFKMACVIIRKHFNIGMYNLIPIEMKKYLNPIRLGRTDTRNIKPKSAVWFAYRVA